MNRRRSMTGVDLDASTEPSHTIFGVSPFLMAGRPLVTFISCWTLRVSMVGSKPIPGDQEEKAVEFVQEFLETFLEGSEDFVQEYTPTTATPIITKGEVALAAQSLLLWKSSERIRRLTQWLIGLTAALVALTVVLAILTWRLSN